MNLIPKQDTVKLHVIALLSMTTKANVTVGYTICFITRAPQLTYIA